MEPKGPRAPRVKGTVNLVSSVARGLENAPTGFAYDAGGELVRIVSRLTHDIERFDSMIRDQRHLLQQYGGELGAFDDKLIRRQSRRISARAAEIVTRAHGALEELHGLSLVVSESSQQQRS